MQQTVTLTTAKLIKYTLFSIIFAALLLVTVILPAEYNIDPTGIGKQLGLTALADASISESSSTSTIKPVLKTDTIDVIVPAGRGVEYKFIMEQYQKLDYEWKTDGESLYFDLHGEPEGDTTGYYESYAIATLDTMQGSFTTPFSGSHGWYWKNKSQQPVTVTLTVTGEYSSHSLRQ